MNVLKGLLIVMIALAMGACDDMLDNIRPYLDEGETVYVGKVDSLYTNVGHNRIELVARLKSGFTQTQCCVVATDPDGGRDTAYYEVDRQNGEQDLKYMYSGLKEGQYDFSIVMYNASGDHSLTVVTEGYSYGKFYQSTLFNRRLTGIEKGNGQVVLKWKSMDAVLHTLVTYTTVLGEEKVIKILAKENEAVIADYQPGSTFTWLSVYKPGKSALDEFHSYSSENQFPDEP